MILLAGLSTLLLSIYTVRVSYSSLPYADGWREIDPLVTRISPLSVRWLWWQQNEHRLIIPKLLLAVDLLWFHANQLLLLFSIFAIQCAHLGVLGWSMRRLAGWRGALWRTGFGLAAFCLFCPSQWENFVWGFQTCFVLPGLFASLSFVWLLLYFIRTRETTRPWVFLILSVVAALCATYSLANGMLLWPLLLGAALLLGMGRAVVTLFTAVGAVTAATYFIGYTHPPHHASLATSVQSPLRLLKYIAVYFGSTWFHERMHPSELLGIAGLVLAAALLWRLRGATSRQNPFSIQIALTLLFCVGTAVITSLGRLNFGATQAFSSRYQTVALLFWCFLGLGALLILSAGKNFSTALVVAQICLVIIVARGAVLAPFAIRDARWHGFQLNAAASALRSGVYDPAQFYYVGLVRPEYLFSAVPLMRQNRLSIFSRDSERPTGVPLTSLFPHMSDDCIGAVDPVARIEGSRPGLRVTGWAWDREHHRPALAVVLVRNGAVDAWAAVGSWRGFVLANGRKAENYVGFTGYLGDDRQSQAVAVYAVLDSHPGTACLVESSP